MLRRPCSESGFTLFEATTALSMIVALASVLLPVIQSVKDDADAAIIASTVETMRSAALRFYEDNGRFPREGTDFTTASEHELSIQQTGLAGWRGPYLDHVLVRGDSPFGNQIYVKPWLTYSTNGQGFDLTGDGTLDATGTSPVGGAMLDGAMIRFWGVPLAVAQKVDTAFDGNLGGEWQDSGRVRYQATTWYLDIFLTDQDGR